MGSGDQTQVVMLAGKCLYPLSTLPAQENIFFNDLFDIKFCARECRDQKRVSNPPELELQVVISLLTWVLGAKLDSSGRAEKMLLTVSLAPLPTLSKCFERRKSFVKFDNSRSPKDNITAQRRAGEASAE